MHLTLTCLAKIQESIDIEVIVVDNVSNAGVMEYIQLSFPKFKFVLNEKNLGFAKANNLGVKYATSDKILILNPDIIISESVMRNALIILLDNHGAVAVKMIDGKGAFLPESARGFPDLKSSFLKMLGLKKWSNYYMDPDRDHSIEVMSGACMFFNKEDYMQIGGLDERYFMYGEDIDISYQLRKAGKKIKYIDNEEIIHFKGRSSVKSNWRYQTAFYNAMKLYWQKNFAWGQNPGLNFLLSFALFGLKLLSALRHSILQVFFPLIDFLGIFAVSLGFTYLWSIGVKNDVGFLPTGFYIMILPLYTLLAIFSMLFAKFYFNEIDVSKLVKASIANLALFLLIYFILPIDFKYSRAVIINLWIISFFVPLVVRWMYSKWTHTSLLFNDTRHLEAHIFPDFSNESQVRNLLTKYSNYRLIYNETSNDALIVDFDNSSNTDLIQTIKNSKYGHSLWIYSASGHYLLKCHGKDDNEYIIAADENLTIFEWTNKLRKRILDIGLTFLALPLSLFSKQSSLNILKSCKYVLFDGYAWVHIHDKSIFRLPADLSEEFKRKYSLKMDIFYYFRYMFIS